MPTERLLTPFEGNAAYPLLRAYMMISEKDMDRFDSLRRGESGETVTVFDTISDQHYEVRRANCGAGCFCAAEVV